MHQIAFLLNLNALLSRSNLLYPVLAVHLVLRCAVALLSTLGNDEVYYTLYAKELDWSYFDHPPMVGALIYSSTFANFWLNEFSVRLGALLIGTLNLYLIYHITKRLGNHYAANIALLLSCTSFYVAIISGTFIMPDTPLTLFWLLSLYFFLQVIQRKRSVDFLLFGICSGLALFSKYHGIYLWGAAGLYVLMWDRTLLKNSYLYLALLLSAVVFIPVILWNLESPFSGLSYHENRVGSDSLLPNFKFFFQEVFGQFFYNNPFVVFLCFFALVATLRKRSALNKTSGFLTLTALPLLVSTIVLSMYNRTLPHWSGPAYFGLIVLAALYWEKNKDSKKLHFSLKGSKIFFLLVILLGLFQIQTGLILGKSISTVEKQGKKDFTVDLSQWKRIGTALSNELPDRSVIITHNWFPAAHLDFYFARKQDSKVYVSGTREKKHQFLKINQSQGAIDSNQPIFYVTTSHYFNSPSPRIDSLFQRSNTPVIFPIKQWGKTKVNVFYWKLNPKKTVAPDEL